jgi:hypothetical protein
MQGVADARCERGTEPDALHTCLRPGKGQSNLTQRHRFHSTHDRVTCNYLGLGKRKGRLRHQNVIIAHPSMPLRMEIRPMLL